MENSNNKNSYSRGSEWRKWDLHIHACDTKLNNQYKSWEELFWKIGAFDIKKIGYGYDDIELGIKAKKYNLKNIFSNDCPGLHIWHGKKNVDILNKQNQESLNYVILKHGEFDFLESEIN